ncbi:DUF1049 domain-containing protein [Pseudonocardia sp. CA-142604]|uniref:DUF1049 domain-containing protein n=1 Tax=Pseudonocardia sp. CA-142604 TaxID=3240024 RepID=UPI003D8C7A6A
MSDTGTGKAVRSSRRRPSTRVIVAVVLVVLAFIFIIENREPAAIRVIIPIVIMPLWAALTGMFVVGLAVGALWRKRR